MIGRPLQGRSGYLGTAALHGLKPVAMHSPPLRGAVWLVNPVWEEGRLLLA
jgi:hypothetical protein